MRLTSSTTTSGRVLALAWFPLFSLLVGLSGSTSYSDAPDFGRQIRPILSNHCFACHGPDEKERQADLRLDTSEGLADVVVPGESQKSELLSRIESSDSDTGMPPASFHKPLSPTQKQLIRDWIEAGGEFEQHWSFVAPIKIEPPQVDLNTSTQPIDAFISAAAVEARLTLTPPTDRPGLLRRTALALTGLPPSTETRDAYLNDDSPEAYERLVDSLLQSPRFGEHFGRYWLDLVRYADTHGLHLDNYREMWPYRDWVIAAFNENKPFDVFVTEQLAGDLFSEPTREQLIASGFNRLNVSTNEGGSIYEEVFARNAIDRTDAFGTVFLGLTAGCAVCHDHKFDPITQRDYYSLLAFYNSLDGREMDGNVKDHPPNITLPTSEDVDKISQINSQLERLRKAKFEPHEAIDAAQRDWELSLANQDSSPIEVLLPLEITTASKSVTKTNDDHSIEIVNDAADSEMLEIIADLPQQMRLRSLRLEALTESAEARVGASSNGNAVLSEIQIATSVDATQWNEAKIASASADIEQSGDGFAITYAFDGELDRNRGWAVAGHEQTGPRSAWFVLDQSIKLPQSKIRVQLHFVSQYAKHQFRRVRLAVTDGLPRVSKENSITAGEWHSLGPLPAENVNQAYANEVASEKKAFKSDEVFKWRDREYRWDHRSDLPDIAVNELSTIDGSASVVVLHRNLTTTKASEVTLLLGSDDGHVVCLNDKQVGIARGESKLKSLSASYKLELKKGNNDLYVKFVNHAGKQRFTVAFQSPAIEIPANLEQLVLAPESERTADTNDSVRTYYRLVHSQHPDWLSMLKQETELTKDREQIERAIPITLVWKELSEPREAHILVRGQYDQLGEVVTRGVPDFLPPLPEDAPQDRLGLARWLTSDNHPLASRVAVNRFWQQIFGIGLVRTSEDFGSQGEPPSHPELLDWLAIDFREHGWDVKRLVKSMVMSEAFQRDSRTTSDDRRFDPENRYLARGPRNRLDAEVLRDQALVLSGMLVDTMGGPSVKPPQPSGLWEAVGYTRSDTAKFQPDAGQAIHRRGVYTFWKRTSPPPQMSTLDAPSRESCTSRRERTNTPLQALMLMNEPQFVAASLQLASLVSQQQQLTSDEQRVTWLFERLTVRLPSESENIELLRLLHELTAYYSTNLHLAEKLVGEPVPQIAAWAIVASTLLNSDIVVNN